MQIKKIIISTFILLTTQIAYSTAQVNYQDSILNSALTNMLKEFASEMDNKCDSHIITVKISYGKKGKVAKTSVSNNMRSEDSAILLTKIQQMGVYALENYGKSKKLKNIDMLIPLRVLSLNNNCPANNLTPLYVAGSTLFDDDNNSKKYFVFSGATMISQNYK